VGDAEEIGETVGTRFVDRQSNRAWLASGALLIAFLAFAPPSASAQTLVTFGADLSQAPNTTIDCTGDPDGGSPITRPGSCTWAEGDNPTAPSEGFITPAGTGTITAVRIRVGATTGPMELVVLTLELDPTNENVSCCTAAYVSPPFTPAANSITTLNTDLPVHTDADGEESAPPYQVGDMLGLSVLESGVDIPAIDELGSGLPENELPSDSVLWPSFAQGETAVMGGYLGYQLDMNADWVESTGSPGPPATTPPPPTITVGSSTPTVTLGSSKPSISHSKVNVSLDCGSAAACDGTIAIENKPLAQATAASKSKKKPKAIVYAKGTFSLKAGADGTIGAPLTANGKTAARKRTKLTVYVDITVGSGTSAKTTSRKVTLRF